MRFQPPRRTVSGCSSVVRARGRGPRGRWCDSSHSDVSPPTQGRDTRLRISMVGVRILSVARSPPGCSSEAERVGDNHDVAGAIPAIQTKIDRFDHTTVPRRNTILRRSLAEVRILSVVLFTSPSGTTLVSKTGEQCSIHWRRALSTCSPAAKALGPDPRDRWCKSSHVDQAIWV